jgi:hypothetical protein
MNSHSRHFLLFAFSFYLIAQTFQQYVLLAGPLASVTGLESTLLAGQHPLNHVRHYLIYFSMFLMIPAFVVMCLQFIGQNKVLSIVAMAFFLFFCALEISYRSIHIFQVMNVWGKEFSESPVDLRADLLPKFQYFFQAIRALYFPLLLSLLMGSACLFALSLQARMWAWSAAMAISCLQQLSRLAGYTPLSFLDVFTGIGYYVLVLGTFGLLIYGTTRLRAH